MNKITVSFNDRVDRDAMATSSFLVNVVQYYIGGRAVEVDLNAMDATYREAFMKTIDFLTMSMEAAAMVFVINRSGKTFDLTQSYVRDAIETARPLTAIDTGTPLKLRFDVPGFLVNGFREIDLWTGNAFDPADIASVAEIGITLSGDGDVFTIANAVDCMVSFSRPATALVEYIIQDPEINQIIAP